MRMKLPFLTGAVAFTIAGIATAGQVKAFFDLDTKPAPSSANATSIQWNIVAAGSALESGRTKGYRPPVAITPVQRLSNLPPQYFHSEPAYRSADHLPAAYLHVMANIPVNINPTIRRSDYAENPRFFGGNFGGGFGGFGGFGGGFGGFGGGFGGFGGGFGGFGGGFGGFGGGFGGFGGGFGGFGGGFGNGASCCYVMPFGNANLPSTWTLDKTGTLTYTVAAVPEPGEWLLMLVGLGLIGLIANFPKQKTVIA